MKSRKIIICLSALLLASTILQAQKLTHWLDYLPFRLTEQINILPAPSLSYSPETNLSFGVAIIGTYKPSRENSPLSTMQLDLLYTLNKQLIVDLDYHWNSTDKRFTAFGSNSFYNYPDLYFSNQDKHQVESIRYKKIEFDNKFFFSLTSNWKAGIIHRIQIIQDPLDNNQGLFLSEMPTGYSGGLSQGLGLGILRDLRNNSLNPAHGSSLINMNLSTYSSLIGSDYQFTRFDFDFRKYLPIFKSHILALQTTGILNSGNPPFTLSGNLGGQSILRAYHKSMFIGRQMIALQAEIRMKIYKRLGAVGFLGVGSVSSQIDEIFKASPKASLGGGLRFLIDKQNQANLRFDIAYGSEGLQYYFSYGEAF